jgi:hypothetical protein
MRQNETWRLRFIKLSKIPCDYYQLPLKVLITREILLRGPPEKFVISRSSLSKSMFVIWRVPFERNVA